MKNFFTLSLIVYFFNKYLYAQENVEEMIVTATKTEKTLIRSSCCSFSCYC